MAKYDSERRYAVKDSPTIDDLPDSVYMSDISADKTRMAVIYKTTSRDDEKAEDGEERYMLTLYDLSLGENGQKLTRNTEFKEVDVSYIKTCDNSIYLFLSVFGKNGYVALSFVELGDTGQLTRPCDAFANCIIYGKEKIVQKIPFQGRAVFLENRLALVGLDALIVYKYTENNGFKKKYTLDTQTMSIAIEFENTKHQTELIKDIPWAKYVELSNKQSTPTAGHYIIMMSRHIHSNVLVTRHGYYYYLAIDKIWSIFDGTLVASYKPQHVENVMAISDDHYYIATYDEKEKVAKIYCTKTNAALHTIPINTQSNAENSTFTLSYMRFFGNGRYIIISGFMPDATNRSEHRVYTFEVWCIPAQKLLFADKQDVYWQPNIIMPFPMEFENQSLDNQERNDRYQLNENENENVMYGRQYNLPEMKAIFTSRENQKTKIESKLLFKQDWSRSNEKPVKDWKIKYSNGKESTYKIKILNEKLGDLGARYELNDSLDIYKNLFCCSISNGAYHFILRFGYYTVQLWHLIKVPSSLAKSEKERIGFQLEEGKNLPYFYKSMEDNELVYIRAYKANDCESGFISKKDWNVHMNGESPGILFTNNPGHIFVKTERKYEYLKNRHFSKMRSSDYIIDIDEIFLPLLNSSVSFNDSSYNDLGLNLTNSKFHEIESACRALHHINGNVHYSALKTKPELDQKKQRILNGKINKLITKLITTSKNIKYFTTISGSRTLAMLASFQIGQEILRQIIIHPKIPINIFNYTKNNYAQENLLTVLIKEEHFYLFNAFFHRVLIDSMSFGPEKLNSLVESLLYLWRKHKSEHLFNCFKKLTYIPADTDIYPLYRSEFDDRINIELFQPDDSSSIQTFNSCSSQEQIDRYEETVQGRLSFKCNILKRTWFFQSIRDFLDSIYEFTFDRNMTVRGELCVVPLPGFNDYRIQHEGILYDDDDKRNTSTINENQNGKDAFEKNVYNDFTFFTKVASGSNETKVFKQQGSLLDPITQYKWNAFLRSRFYMILFIHAIYYISYSTAVSFPEELYNYTPGDSITDPRHFVSIVLMFVSGFILLVPEIRQFLREKKVYLTSFFNWVDIAAFTLPVANFCLLLSGSEILLDIGSVTILILWIHAILRLRAFSYFGHILETIIQIVNKIMPFICIMFLVVFAFTHAFIYRLRNMSDQFFQEQYQGGPTDAEGNPLDNSTFITVYDTSSQNDFSNPFKAFSVVWFFIYGVFDPINDGDAGDDIMTKILIILFSFVTILIFSNMVIALMSSTVDEVRRQGYVARLTHFSAVISEIELFWCSKKRKYNRNNNPNYIYYVADKNIVKNHVDELKSEYERLLEELKKW